MAVLTGISGMQLGDGAGGKIALSIETAVLRILSDMSLTYMTATIRTPGQLNSGTVTYYVPELLKTEDYGTGTTALQVPQAGTVNVNIDTRRTAKYTVETFDVTRLNESGYLLGMISTGLAMAVQADLNAQFLNYLHTQLKDTLTTQKIELDFVAKENTALKPEEARQDLLKMEYALNKVNQMYNKTKLGVNKSEVLFILSPTIDSNIRYAFWNQPNDLGNWVVEKTIAGKQIGNIKYLVENMLDNNIPANTSFSKDKAYDFTKLKGIMLHNEAVAMPININTVVQTIDPVAGNPNFICKYQFGVGLLRPELIYAVIAKGTPLK